MIDSNYEQQMAPHCERFRPGVAMETCALRRVVVFLGALLILAPSVAGATGWGANFTYGHRSGDLSSGDIGLDVDWKSNDFSAGFTLDTAVAKNKLFNYRMNLNYERAIIDLDFNGLKLSDIKSNGLAMDHIFGFGIVRNRSMRLWLGPAVRIAVSGVSQGLVNAIQGDVGVGAIAGLNIHLGDVATAGVTVGYQYNGSFIGLDAGVVDTAVTGGLHRVSAGVVILFRGSGDRYEP
jgi:hypothetical protein